jgi:hypothetical protein
VSKALQQVLQFGDQLQLINAQVQELSLIQLRVKGETDEARNAMGDAVIAMQEVLEEFDARIKRIEEKLGIETETLDNEGTAT